MDVAHLWDAEPGYFNTAGYGLPPRAAVAALAEVMEEWQHGRTSWEKWDTSVSAARHLFARLVGVPTADVSIGAAVSQQIGLVATAVPDGARVLVAEGDYASLLFPFLVAAGRGVEVVTAPLGRLAEAVDARTAVVAFSVVQSASGAVAPVAEIAAAARANGALLVGDATQACGWLPVDASQFDALAAHTYKWLMAPRGASFLVLAPALREQLQPLAAGWYAADEPYASYYAPRLRLAADARRFDHSPAWFSWVGAAAALSVVEGIGVDAIHRHDVELADRLRGGLGLPDGNSAIVSVDLPGAEEKLERAGIRASVRAGRVRLSCHIYTTAGDVDRALDVLVG